MIQGASSAREWGGIEGKGRQAAVSERLLNTFCISYRDHIRVSHTDLPSVNGALTTQHAKTCSVRETKCRCSVQPAKRFTLCNIDVYKRQIYIYIEFTQKGK